MTTKEKIIRQSIQKVSKRITVLEGIQNATPATDIIDIRTEAQQLLEANKTIEQRTSKEFLSKLEALSTREKKCWKIIEKQKNWENNLDELIKLQVELGDLKNELFYIERNKL